MNFKNLSRFLGFTGSKNNFATGSKASKYLQDAQTQFLNGHFREAVGLCRDVVESISVFLNDEKDKMPPEIDSWFDNSRNMNKEERI